MTVNSLSPNITPSDVWEYRYRAEWVRVIDGDTVVLDIDLGCGIWLRNESCRLFGINAPEKRGAEKAAGLAAKEHMIKLLEATGRKILITTRKDKRGKYGRYVIELWEPMQSDGILSTVRQGVSLNEQMVADGHAELRNYG